MKNSIILAVIFLLGLSACSKRNTLRNEEEEKVYQFAVDIMQIPRYRDGSHLDTLVRHFDIPPDSGKMRSFFNQQWIPWGKLRPVSISLKQIVSMHLKDGNHYYMVIFLSRWEERRGFNYLFEVFDDGKSLWLRQFYMWDISVEFMRNVWIEKRRDHAVWMVKNSGGKCEWNGTSLTYRYKFPSINYFFKNRKVMKMMKEQIPGSTLR
jgi:hypothetical protein